MTYKPGSVFVSSKLGPYADNSVIFVYLDEQRSLVLDPGISSYKSGEIVSFSWRPENFVKLGWEVVDV